MWLETIIDKISSLIYLISKLDNFFYLFLEKGFLGRRGLQYIRFFETNKKAAMFGIYI